MTLTEILELVGTLDDVAGDNTPRERVRSHLMKSVTTVGALRDYVETCLRTSGPQYARALQDLVNHCGRLLGFTTGMASLAALLATEARRRGKVLHTP